MYDYVPPSSVMAYMNSPQFSSLHNRFNDTPLKIGVLIDCYEKNDERNISKFLPEYVVITKQTSAHHGTKWVKYTGCISVDGFGGVADFFEYKLRTTLQPIETPSNGDSNQSPPYSFSTQNGSLVLLLCIDGFSEKPIIIGGIPNVNDGETQRQTTLTDENQLHLEGEYNGVNWQINNDGEFTLTFKSATENDGTPANSAAGGTSLKMDQEGSVEINTNSGDQDILPILKINKQDNDIATSSSTMNINTHTDTTVVAGGDFGVQAYNAIINTNEVGSASITTGSWVVTTQTGEATIDSTGPVSIKSAAKMDIDGGNQLKIKSIAKTEIDAGIQFKLKSNTRMEFDAKLIELKAKRIVLGGSSGVNALNLNTKFLGTDSTGAPVVSSVAGPVSQKVFIA